VAPKTLTFSSTELIHQSHFAVHPSGTLWVLLLAVKQISKAAILLHSYFNFVLCNFSFRRFKQYQPLREDNAENGGSFAVTSMPLLLWNLLSRQSPGESRPLLQGRIV